MFAKFDFEALDHNRTANVLAVTLATVATTAAALCALLVWFSFNPAYTVSYCLPGQDNAPADMSGFEKAANLSGIFLAADGKPSDLPGAWTMFRGPHSDNVVEDAPPLAGSWGNEGPKRLWSIEVGDGYAAPVVLNGCVYLLDYDSEKEADALRCLSLATGEEIWRRSYEVNVKRNHGMSRTVPAVTDKYIVTMGPRCHVVCLDTATGDFRWGIDLQKDYGTVEPLWYTGQCPIIEDGETIIAACGTDVFMMGVDCETGAVNWTTPNTKKIDMSHSSVIPMTILGKKMYVYCGLGGIAGVSAEGPDKGTVLWDRHWDAKVVAPSPVQVGEDHIFMAAGYGKGSMMLQLAKNGDAFESNLVYEHTPKDGLSCEQQTPVYYKGLLYGILPSSAGGLKEQFACYDPGGKLVWSSGADNRFGLGPFLLADDKFYIVDDEGMMTVLDAKTPGYKQLSQHRVLEGHDAWGPLALAGTRMLARDMGTLVCLDVGATQVASNQ